MIILCIFLSNKNLKVEAMKLKIKKKIAVKSCTTKLEI